MEETKFSKDNKIFNENFQANIDDLKIMSNFFNNFINNIKNLTLFQNNKSKSKRGSNPNIYESILLNNVENIYVSFKTCINSIKNITNKIQNDLIKQIDLFIDEQSKY